MVRSERWWRTLADPGPPDVTLHTLHEDVTVGFARVEAKLTAGFADLKATLVTGFRSLPSRESGDEMVRLLREGNRLQEARFSQLDVRIREQHLETHQVLHALADSQHVLLEGHRILTGEVRVLAADLRALIARLDALIRGRGDGTPAP